MKKRQLLNEIMGVPKAVDFWVDNFSIILAGMAKGLVSKDEVEESDVDYVNSENETVTDTAYRARTVMEGKEFMNWILKINNYTDLSQLLADPRFQQFPLYNPTVSLSLYFLPDELFQLEFGGKDNPDLVEGSHAFRTDEKAISKIGKNKIFVKQKLNFQIYLPSSDLDNLDIDSIRKMVKVTVSHELVHAYETFHRVSTSGDPFQGQESFLNAAQQLMRDDKYPQWGQFLTLVYLHLSFEINARVTQFYYSVKDKDIKNIDEFMVELKKSSVWKELQMLENFKADDFINSFKMRGGNDLFGMMNDIGKQMERRSQGLPAIKPIKSPKEGMQHLIQGWDSVLQMLNLRFSEQGVYKGKLMELVPTKAMKDPYNFFKFFEKRFHKKAEKFKRKLYNISALVLDKSLMEK